MGQPGDEELVKRSREGHMPSFNELLTKYEKKVAAVVQSMLGVTPEAEGVGQEVFVRFYKSLDSFRGGSAVSTYLIRIAINLSLNEIKRRKRRNFFFKPMEEKYDIKEPDEAIEMYDLLRSEINRLDPDLRAVVTLRLVEGYSTEETAAILRIPLGTVLSRLSRAQKKIKSAITNKGKI
jgi:RNA polymerase sigma-70 factor, ECF subfamily